MKVLHLEDNLCDAELARALIDAEWPDCTVTRADNRNDCVAALKRGGYDLILSDFTMASFNGLEALHLARQYLPGSPFIFFSGTIGEERALEAIRAGALDYVLKDNLKRLIPSIRRALKESEERRLRERAELRLREQADIIDRASESIVVCDLTGCISCWNRGAERLYGVPGSLAVGRTLAEVFADGALERLRLAYETPLAERDEWMGEVPALLQDGREHVIDLHLMLVRDDARQPKARLCIAMDVTERKRLEEQFLHAQRLESLGLLAAGIAHDLNNVLAPVLMAGPLLRVRVTDPSDLRTLDILEKSAERGAGLVRQILGFAHGNRGGLQVVQVKHLARDIGEVITASFPKTIAVEVDVPPDLWPVQANPTQIHQILLNLCVNARDAMMPRGGILTLRAENRLLDEAAAFAIEGGRPGAFLVIEVADTGTGIAPEVLERIWEPFFTTKPQGQGTGLGLATVRGVVAGHGGFVEIDTKVGRGTTFRVFLPASKPSDSSPTPPARTAMRKGGGELILVVDDEPTIRHMTSAILTRQGYRVVLARDGVDGIGVFTQYSTEIRMVVSDINMPNLDGIALAVVLKRLRPDVGFVTMTGIGSEDTARASIPSGVVDAMLQKPFTPETLLRVVDQLLGGRVTSG